MSPKIKRFNLEAHIHFVTSKTKNATQIFSNKNVAQLFVSTLLNCRKRYKFLLFGFVVMPDHFHALIQPDKDYSISQVMQKIKSLFAYEYRKVSKTNGSIWQKSFYDFVLNSGKKLIEKINYVHYNPVRKGMVSSPEEYPFSSIGILDQMDLSWAFGCEQSHEQDS